MTLALNATELTDSDSKGMGRTSLIHEVVEQKLCLLRQRLLIRINSVAGAARRQFGVVGQASRLSRIAQGILTVW